VRECVNEQLKNSLSGYQDICWQSIRIAGHQVSGISKEAQSFIELFGLLSFPGLLGSLGLSGLFGFFGSKQTRVRFNASTH
jgi:hypothetical protein